MKRFPGLTTSSILFDGMTIQQVGEVVLDANCTGPIRARCCASYIRALEEFAFAAVFSNRIVTNPNLPPVGNEYPGIALLKDEYVGQIIAPLPEGLSNRRLADLLDDGTFRDLVKHDVARFPRDASGVFDEWLIREVCAYPLSDYEENEAEVRFGTRTYLKLPDIEMCCP